VKGTPPAEGPRGRQTLLAVKAAAALDAIGVGVDV
jgi:hypothetical protein